LGFGGGFYDKYFGEHRDNTLYGLAYDFQMNIDFEVNEYDIAMDHIFMAKVG
ncbi:MAG: 5-formyltetrahydrofolate cyclo-ligase, partial [Lachnoanaerobaculum gingivalis]